MVASMLLATVTAGLVIAPTAAAESNHRLQAEAGTGVYPQCARDNNYEYTHANSYGGSGTMFYPNDGCTSQHDLTPVGINYDDTVRVTGVRYVNTGYADSNICGYFSFAGRAVGSSDVRCGPNDQWIVAPVTTTPAEDDQFLIVTWHTTGGTSSIINAYLDYIDLTSSSYVDPCELNPQDCQPPPPECNELHPWLCEDIDPIALCDALLGTLLQKVGQATQLDILPPGEPPITMDPPSMLPPPGPPSPPVDVDCTPCVTGEDPECIVGYTCLIGPPDQCLVPWDPAGCGIVCDTLREVLHKVCLLFLPAGLVGNILVQHMPDKIGYRVSCRPL